MNLNNARLERIRNVVPALNYAVRSEDTWGEVELHLHKFLILDLDILNLIAFRFVFEAGK